jgi:hypothetical protein
MTFTTNKSTAFTVMMLGAASCLWAQQPYIPTAPKPPQIAAAKTVFLSNDTDAPMADSDKIFDEIYACVQRQNRFIIVPTLANADLILQFSTRNLLPPTQTQTELEVVTLRVIDSKTNVILWSVSDSGHIRAIDGAHGKKNAYDIIDEIVGYLKIIATPLPSK